MICGTAFIGEITPNNFCERMRDVAKQGAQINLNRIGLGCGDAKGEGEKCREAKFGMPNEEMPIMA